MKILKIFLVMCLFSPAINAKEMAGIEFDESVSVAGANEQLKLNGLAVRHKLFFKIYVAALYVEQISNDANKLIKHAGAKRMLMHFVYDEVPQEKLVKGWIEGFEDNLSAQDFNELKPRIDQFNGLFETLYKDDVVILDYLPEQGTRVNIKGRDKGIIKGEDFNQALLKIWLGDEPVTEEVKLGLLGVDE